jgi:hypothetical protein
MIDTRNRWPAEAAALLLPILIVCGQFLFTPKSLTGREFQSFFRSRAAYAQEMAERDGEWPRWNGRQHAGTPFLGDLHGSLHYPPNLLFLAIPPERAFGFLFAFHMVVAAIGMYRLSRYFEFRRSASTLGGVAYGVALSVAAHMDAGALAHFVTPALAPWILLLILRMVKRASMIRLVLLAITFGLVLLGGSPQDLPYLLLLCPGLLIWTAVDAGRRKRPWRGSSAVLTAVSAVMGVTLAAAALLPAVEVVLHAERSFAPAAVARDWRVLYVGVLPAVAAVLPFQNSRRGPTLFFAFAAVAALFPAILLPRLPLCSFWVFALCLSGLAAGGWDGLARGRYPQRKLNVILGVLGGVAVIAAGLVTWRFGILKESAIALGLFGATAFVVGRLRSDPRAILAAVLLTAGDLCFFSSRIVRTQAPEEAAAAPWYAAHIGPERTDFRLYDLTSADAAPAAHGFRLLNGYGHPRLSNLKIAPELLEELNVRWLVSAGAPPHPGWRELARHDGRILYENPQSRRAAYLLATDDPLGPPLKIHRTAHSIEVGGRTYQTGRLVVSESWMPGWKAYMARQEAPVLQGPHSFLTVDVPAGDWYVTLKYEPDVYRTGRLISSSAVVLLIGLLVAGMKRSKIAIS